MRPQLTKNLMKYSFLSIKKKKHHNYFRKEVVGSIRGYDYSYIILAHSISMVELGEFLIALIQGEGLGFRCNFSTIAF